MVIVATQLALQWALRKLLNNVNEKHQFILDSVKTEIVLMEY